MSLRSIQEGVMAEPADVRGFCPGVLSMPGVYNGSWCRLQRTGPKLVNHNPFQNETKAIRFGESLAFLRFLYQK